MTMDSIQAPYGEVIELRQIIHDTGVPLLRVLVREGERFTRIDLDPATAYRWGQQMTTWAETVVRQETG